MPDILRREFIYIWYYITVLFEQLAPYWAAGLLVGSLVSVFGKRGLSSLFEGLKTKKLGILGLLPASALGIASPLCMYGTIPIAASFYEKGMRHDWLAAFMMSSALLNPQLIIYSAALGKTALAIRIAACVVCGIAAGLLVWLYEKSGRRQFFRFGEPAPPADRDTDPNVFMRLLKNLWRNLKATGGWFVLGILLAALFQRYVPADAVSALFGKNEGFGVLMAASIGVPLYACGGGTIPMLAGWLASGMSMGAAAAFMITGPATKITNLGALKAALGIKSFALYLAFVCAFALAAGLLVNVFV